MLSTDLAALRRLLPADDRLGWDQLVMRVQLLEELAARPDPALMRRLADPSRRP